MLIVMDDGDIADQRDHGEVFRSDKSHSYSSVVGVVDTMKHQAANRALGFTFVMTPVIGAGARVVWKSQKPDPLTIEEDRQFSLLRE